MSIPEWYVRTNKTWIDVFVEQTERQGPREFLKLGDRRLSYSELREDVDRVASGLLRAGVRPGGTVAVWMSNSIEWIIAQWATYRVGAALIPLSSYYKVPEALHALRESLPSALFVSSTFVGKIDARAMVLEILPELASSGPPKFGQVPSLQLVVTVDDWDLPGARSLAEIRSLGYPISDEGLDFARSRTTPFDVCNHMYTSGTTGFPKAGISMHRNNMATIDRWCARADVDQESVILCLAPLFGNLGCAYVSQLTMYVGARMVLTERFDPDRSLHEIEAEHTTYIAGTPEMWRMLALHPRFARTDVSSVRGGHIGGSALDPTLAPTLYSFAPKALYCFGLSECGGIATVTGPWDDEAHRLHSVGTPLECIRVEIHDPNTGLRLSSGAVGEIWLGDALPGSSVGKGYLAGPGPTAAAITPEGWFRTGDLGRMDADGYLYFVGRVKNMFTVGGTNVYPAEVERVIAGHVGVGRVFVVGVPDERLGSVPVAFVVPDGDLDVERLRVALANELSIQKLPRRMWRLADSEIPVTPLGKVRVIELVDRAKHLLATEGAATTP